MAVVRDSDFLVLHERNLVRVGRIDGFRLPPVDRIIGAIKAGNEVDAYVGRIAHDLLWEAWARGDSVVQCCTALDGAVQTAAAVDAASPPLTGTDGSADMLRREGDAIGNEDVVL
jgi:hypothetical protein